jgi:hypothetical protein
MTLIPALSMALSTRSTWLKSKTPGFGSSVPHVDSADAYDCDTGRLHHPDVFIETIRRSVFLVIGSAEEDRLLTLESLSDGLERVRDGKNGEQNELQQPRYAHESCLHPERDAIVSLKALMSE